MKIIDKESLLNLFDLIESNYKLLKDNPSNEELFLNLKNSLDELQKILDKRLIPSHLYSHILKFHDDCYRLMSKIYTPKKRKK